MSKLQTMAAGLLLMLGVWVGLFMIFRDPIPYAYDNLPDKLSQTMRKNGVHWAKIRVDGNEVFISGVAPNSSEMVLAKALVQKEAGVTANFMGVKVKNLKTRDDFNTDEEWQEFKQTNASSSTQTYSTPNYTAQSGDSGGKAATSPEEQSKKNPRNTASTDNKNLEEDNYILNFHPKTAGCIVENRLNTNDYEIIFKGHTAVIDSRSLGDLNWIAELDETCPLEIKLLRKGENDEKSLSYRRIDEVRYHLMSAGIVSKRIATDTQ